MISQFDQEPSVQQVRAALDQTFGGQNVVVQTYGDPSQRQIMVRVPEVGAESGASLSSGAEKVKQALQAANLGNVRRWSAPKSSARRSGSELTSKGISGHGAVAGRHPLLHRVPLSAEFRGRRRRGDAARSAGHAAFLAFFQYDLTLNVIAAILTVTGYSTNDTIVIFDRVRENLRGMRRDSLHHVINVALNQTLGRTIITAGTALLSARRALRVRRRSAARVRVHDDRRHHHRHLFEHLRRGGDRDDLARQGPTRPRRTRSHAPPSVGIVRSGRPRRSSRPASRSRSAKRAPRKHAVAVPRLAQC